ncbi:cupin domain-containing protein [Streptomyces sp. NPDC002838]|uniref:cupin domain-containing protein n=1 Tax=Streptomyces sp. NPDC002838 TaxID=3154436 RepID=UPI00331C5A65
MTLPRPSGATATILLGDVRLSEYPTPEGAPMSTVRLIMPEAAEHDWTGARVSWRLYHVLAGELDFVVGTQEMHASAGDVLFIPPGTRYRYRNGGAGAAEIILCTSPGYDPADELPTP